MAPDTRGRLWVLFDTSTNPVYYRDVHNLLALPPGAAIRYTYRKEHFTQDALAALKYKQMGSALVLVVYAQWRGYVKGQPDPKPGVPHDEIEFIGTRVGRMARMQSDGESTILDFTVAEYPKNDPAALRAIVNELGPAATPYRKWVAVSSEARALDQLRFGDAAANWQQIIQRLAIAPMQFAGDAFWRLEGPTLVASPRMLFRRASTRAHVTSNGVTEYSLPAGATITFAVSTYTPPAAEQKTPERYLVSTVTGSSSVSVNPSSLSLRPYSREIIQVLAKRGTDLRVSADVRFSTSPEDAVPVGPQFALHFAAVRSVLADIAALICLVVAAYIWKRTLDTDWSDMTSWWLLWTILSSIGGTLSLIYFKGSIPISRGAD